jgi:CII-binding regulator of phage lambda lysogenization HflD
MSVSGVYTYEDDGVINPDNIALVPGSLIPVAPGSRGLNAIQSASNFDVAQLVLQDMRQNIKKALYMETLGRPEGTPMTATEVSERMADLSRQIGSSFGRLQAELIHPLLKRIIRILSQQGRIELPKVNGREVKVAARSPLAKAQHLQDVADVNRFNEILAGTFGPQMINIIMNQNEVAKYIAGKMNLPEKLIRDQEEQQQIVQQISQLNQSAGQGEIPE